jgi:hypothetical protein
MRTKDILGLGKICEADDTDVETTAYFHIPEERLR